ncbi:MAG: saccharopine dehydrogenase NADP-binding domain-containing protein [Burkholderiales bacterium]|nr:saccharopine dehydrogenase NADP-binding domain-containing protein [Burkholderiales bacterium]
MHTMLVLGGYGFFGTRIAAGLVGNSNVRVLIAGRDQAQARGSARAMQLPDDHAIRLDATAADFSASLRTLGVNTVIHTAGPFQGQDYKVASDAIAAGANYIDLADGRRFVAGIGVLDDTARCSGVLVASGASSVPALSSAIVDVYAPAFERLESIRLGIGSGARAPGLATVQGVFGYCGKPFRRLENGAWTDTHGWLDLMRYEFPQPVGRRFLGSCDVPDLEVFPTRYGSVRTVTFHGGFASDIGHLFVWMMAQLVRAGVISSVAPLARPLNRMSRWLEPLISDKGAMFVEMEGVGRDGQAMKRRWCILAAQNHGPYIPCAAAIALAKKLADGVAPHSGARPCVGMLTVEECLAPLKGLDVRVVADPV